MPSAAGIADEIGKHAIAAWLGALALQWLLLVVLWWTLGHARSAALRGAWLRWQPASHWLMGLLVVVTASLTFAEAAQALDLKDEMGRFDVALVQALRLHLSAGALKTFALITRLGDTVTLTALCIGVSMVLLWLRERTLALGWILAVAGNAVLNAMLKSLFSRARPPHDPALAVIAEGWSFPSGHSSGAVVAYGMLAYTALHFVSPRARLPVLMAAVATAFTIGLSRAYLQVHYASDVLAGFASGMVWLTVCVRSLEWLRSRRESVRTGASLS